MSLSSNPCRFEVLVSFGDGQDAILVLGTHFVLGVRFEELVILVVV